MRSASDLVYLSVAISTVPLERVSNIFTNKRLPAGNDLIIRESQSMLTSCFCRLVSASYKRILVADVFLVVSFSTTICSPMSIRVTRKTKVYKNTVQRT
jgi:hypothetical protein